jgi:hypothetical protein
MVHAASDIAQECVIFAERNMREVNVVDFDLDHLPGNRRENQVKQFIENIPGLICAARFAARVIKNNNRNLPVEPCQL